MVDMTMADLNKTHIAVAHDVAAAGEAIAKASDGFSELADYQKDAIVAWYTVKTTLAAIERAGLVTAEQIDAAELRNIAKQISAEVLQNGAQ